MERHIEIRNRKPFFKIVLDKNITTEASLMKAITTEENPG